MSYQFGLEKFSPRFSIISCSQNSFSTMYIVCYAFNMHGKYINRLLTKTILDSLSYFPISAILGPRQVGKSTLAKEILKEYKNSLYLDLEKPSDLSKLDQAELYLESHKDKLVCLDEIQRRPDLFPLLRSLVDENKRSGHFLILGSAAPDLLKQSSESLAGRIEYLELTPFQIQEVNREDFITYWVRGGYPDSYLAPNEELSNRWRDNFITTFLERDLRNLDINASTENLRRFWKMSAHYHGQILNLSKIGQSLNMSHTTVQNYIDIMVSTFMIRVLPAFNANIKKRLIKSPKLYIRDSGICHRLLGLDHFDDLAGHPTYGASFEGVVIENIITKLSGYEPSFYRTSQGAEIDLILSKGKTKIAIECKATKSPTVSKGFYLSCDDLGITERYVIAIVDEMYTTNHNTIVCNLQDFMENIANKF